VVERTTGSKGEVPGERKPVIRDDDKAEKYVRENLIKQNYVEKRVQ
jgi:hypothetical protein